MIISNITTRPMDTLTELSATIIPDGIGGRRFKVWFRLPSALGPPPAWGDSFLAGFLIPCMYSGENIRVAAPVSGRLLEAVPAIQRQFLCWYRDLSRIDVIADDTHDGCLPDRSPGKATFFSTGVDSVYTLVKHRHHIEKLILIHGFENPLQATDLLATTLASVKAYGASFKKEWLTVTTNLRGIADQNLAPWGRRPKKIFFGAYYMGSMLAAVGLAMQHWFKEIFIPASFRHDALVPYSSHPLIDPLWSTENLAFVHDGCEAGRLEKIQTIAAQFPDALRYLQVCEANLEGETNCCRCDKCLRTMLGLALCGRLDTGGTFHRPLTLRRLSRVANLKRWRSDYEELMCLAQNQNVDKVAGALGKLLCKGVSTPKIANYLHTALRDARRYLSLTADLPPLRKRTRVWRNEQD